MAKQKSFRHTSGLRKKAEDLLAEQERNLSRIPLDKDMQELSHELSVYTIELEMQNDELRRSQEQLEAARERYLNLYEHAPVGYLTLDKNGIVLEMNLTAARILGIERTLLLKKPFSFRVAPESQDTFHLHQREVLRSPGTHTCELMLKKNKGQEQFPAQFESIAAPDNGASAIRTVLTDITGRKRTEEALRDNEQRLRLAKNAAHLGIFDWDLTSGALEWDPRVREIWGIGPDEDINFEVFLSGVHPDDRARIQAAIDRVLDPTGSGEYYEEYKVVSRADKVERWVAATGRVWFRKGRAVRLVGIVEDITERRRAKEALRNSEERLRAFVTATSDVVYRMSADWSEMHQLHGKEFIPDTLTSGAAWLEKYIPQEDQPDVTAAINEAIRTKNIFELEHRVLRVDGTVGWTFSRAIPLLDDHGEIIEWFGTASDITERKHTHEELKKARDSLQAQTEELRKAYDQLVLETTQRQQAEEQLRQTQKMEAIGTLAGGIAHDFNNMLAVIMGNAEMALDDAVDGRSEGSHQIEQILKASKRARDLVKQILTFSRKSEGQRRPLKVSLLVKETAKLLRGSLPSTIGIEVDINTDSDTILADPTQIQQVLMNLSSNAAHAMSEEGTLTIDLSDTIFREGDPTPDRDMQPGSYAVLTVKDTGTGIPKNVRDKIFEPFFTTKEPGEGTGMGLSVVFGVVKSLGGAITVESKVGKGSAFTVFFPSSEPAVEEEPRRERALPTGNERVLVVDDEHSVVEIAFHVLKRLGYQVTTAGSGPEGWRKFEDNPYGFDLVITDHVMPEITGMRLAERMLAVRKDLPVILFTGYSPTVSPERAKEAGISEFLMKPVEKRRLAETVRRVLDKRVAG